MMRNFWAQNGPLLQIRIFSRKPVNEPCFFHSCISTCQKSKSYIYQLVKLTIKEYWNLIGREQFLAITWELDFFQACRFCRMLINHKNFRFTQIPDKANDMIFLKSRKTLFLGHFWPFFPDGDFFQKFRLSHKTIYGPLTPC